MPKASPLLGAFNGGLFSELLAGRTNLDKYPISLRRSINFIPTAQGPILRRSGTLLQTPTYRVSSESHLLEFAFSSDQVFAIEAAHLRFRWHSEAGLLTTTAGFTITSINPGSPTVKVAATGHDAVVGSQVVLSGFAFETNLNGRVGNVTAVAGSSITTDIPRPAGSEDITTAKVATVYHLATPYVANDVENIVALPDRNDVYLFCDGYAPRKLTRYGATDWRLVEIAFVDGPYDNINETSTRVKPSPGTGGVSSLGNAYPKMTSDTLPSGTVTASSAAANHEGYRAFDENKDTYWQGTINQFGTLEYEFPDPIAIDGYSIEAPRENDDTTYKALDYAPGSWQFEAFDDDVADWIVLDSKTGYIDYSNLRSAFFKIKNDIEYTRYRIVVRQATRNGPLPIRIAGLSMTSRARATVRLDFTSVTGINNDAGFTSADIGRMIRLEGDDGLWRSLLINAVTTTTRVEAEVLRDVLASREHTTEWRLGLFSPGTGYPTCATFYEDRLVMGGVANYPDWLIASVTGKYDVIAQTDADGSVSDDNGIVVRCNSRRLGRIEWISSDNRSLLLGTGSGEWQVSSADLQMALTARTAKARRISARGSASVVPVLVDRQHLYVQRGGRTLREMAYSFDVDGYKTPSMSLFASHLGVSEFKQIVFCSEPNSVAWVRCADGELLGFTYNREENVMGWHQHNIGGTVESILSLPSADGRSDTLWLVVRRVIDGVVRRFIEILAPTWDFGSTLATASFADCAIRYQGAAINTVYGLYYHEGGTVTGLADGAPFKPQVVVDGKISLPDGQEAENILLGFGFNSLFETNRLEAGAGDGTAQGKEKRITGVVLRLWESGGGEFGTRDSEDATNDSGLEHVAWLDNNYVLDDAPALFTGDTKKLSMPSGYNKSGTIVVRQDADIALPLNVIAVLPQLITQDR